MPIKIKGVRSVHAKLERMASELRNDAERILREQPEYAYLADDLQMLAVRMHRTVTRIRNH